MNVSDMETAAKQVSGLMRVVSNTHRLLILCQLVESEKSVSDLARLPGVREAAMSQKLSVLRKDSLVGTRREAQTIYDALARDNVRTLMRFLYENSCGGKAKS